MNILLISFSVNHSMGDNFKMISKDLSSEHNVAVLTNSGILPKDVGTYNICNVRFNRKKIFDFVNPYNYWKILKFVNKVNYDVVFIYSSHPINFWIYTIVNRKKIIPFVHDHILHSGVSKFDAFFHHINYWLYYKKSAKIIVSCNYIKNEILRLRMMHNADDIEVNYLGLLTNLNFPIKQLDEDIDVLFFGRIEYYKGLDVLCKAAVKLPQYRFVIAGKGDLNSIYPNIEVPHNCDHINKYVPDEEIAELIQRSKIIVLPYRDATGTQTIQSVFFYSKPIVATNVGCFPEYLTHNLDSIIIPPEDEFMLSKAIKDLLSEDVKRQLMGKNGNKKLYTIFSNKNITQGYIRIFNSIKFKNLN